MKWKPYPSYRPTAAEWIKEIPAHWEVDRLKWTIDFARNGFWGDEPEGGPDDIWCIRVADFDRSSQIVNLDEPTLRKVVGTERDGRVLRSGDLLLEKSGGGEGSPVGYVVEYTHDAPAICSNFIARMVPSAKVRSRFLRYLHQALYSARINLRSIKQTSGIQNLDSASYFNEMVPYPPPPEQDAIATFLDRETARIDTLITEQRALIARLGEKWESTITIATSQGLHSGLVRRNTGNGFVPVVPEHWRVDMLKRHWSVTDCKHHTVKFVDEGQPVVSIAEMKGNRLCLEDAKKTSQKEFNFLREGRSPNSGDVILCRNASVGMVAYVDTDAPFCLGQDVCLLSSVRSDNKFLYYCFLSTHVTEQINAMMVGATFKRINIEQIRELWIAYPPEREQVETCTYLDREAKKVGDLIQQAETSITLLLEHRSALITAVVTGKVDVRGAVA